MWAIRGTDWLFLGGTHSPLSALFPGERLSRVSLKLLLVLLIVR